MAASVAFTPANRGLLKGGRARTRWVPVRALTPIYTPYVELHAPVRTSLSRASLPASPPLVADLARTEEDDAKRWPLAGFAFALVVSVYATTVIRSVPGDQGQPLGSEEGRQEPDLVGVDGAKRELAELVAILTDPDGRFAAAGVRLPKGCLLVGEPGTGKTALMRWLSEVANEVGVSSLFTDGANLALPKVPAIVFIDDADMETLAMVRALLDTTTGVLVVASSHVSSPKFERVIHVEMPDAGVREALLLTRSTQEVVREVARLTDGFSPRDLEQLANEAAISGAAAGRPPALHDFERALDLMTLGPEHGYSKGGRVELWCTAVHEAGHALVGLRTGAEVRKVSVAPRPRSNGVTVFTGGQEGVTRDRLEALLTVAMAGRAAEELVFGAGGVTAGAESDLERATAIATAMVTRFGFSHLVGPVHLGDGVSESTRAVVDAEVRVLLQTALARARATLAVERRALTRVAEHLMETPTLTGDDVRNILFEK